MKDRLIDFLYNHSEFATFIILIALLVCGFGICYIFGHCDNCGWLPQRGWGVEYCGHCGHKF